MHHPLFELVGALGQCQRFGMFIHGRAHSWLSLYLSRPRLGDGFDRIDDRLVTGAPAVIAGKMFADHITARHPAARQKFLRADQHAGRAEAALQRVAPAKRVLQVGDDPGIGQALDRLYVGAIALHGKEQAAAHHRVIKQHGASAADALLAADMRAGQSEIVAQEIHQRFAGFDPFANFLAIDAQFDVEKSLSHALRPKARYFCFGSFPRKRESSYSENNLGPRLRGGRAEYKGDSTKKQHIYAVLATISRTISMARRNSVIEPSIVRNAAWAVSVTFTMRASGLSEDSGSA